MKDSWMDLWERSKKLHSWLKREHPEVLDDMLKDRARGLCAEYSPDSPYGKAYAEWERLGEPS